MEKWKGRRKWAWSKRHRGRGLGKGQVGKGQGEGGRGYLKTVAYMVIIVLSMVSIVPN